MDWQAHIDVAIHDGLGNGGSHRLELDEDVAEIYQIAMQEIPSIVAGYLYMAADGLAKELRECGHAHGDTRFWERYLAAMQQH